MNAIKSAIEAVGSTAELARRLGVVAMTVTQWKRRGQIPAERCLEVEAATGISRYELRPDVYGPKPDPTGKSGGARAVHR